MCINVGNAKNNRRPRNNHDFKNAGNVMGQLYNTAVYDPKYKGKKGMKFFVCMVAAITIFSVIFLLISPFPKVSVLFAGEDGISHYELKVDFYGNFKVEDSNFFEYEGDDFEYKALSGEEAQIALLIHTKDIGITIASVDILDKLASRGYFPGIRTYIIESDRSKIHTYDIYESDFDLHYGLPVDSEFIAIELKGAEFMAFTQRNDIFSKKQICKLIEDFSTVRVIDMD